MKGQALHMLPLAVCPYSRLVFDTLTHLTGRSGHLPTVLRGDEIKVQSAQPGRRLVHPELYSVRGRGPTQYWPMGQTDFQAMQSVGPQGIRARIIAHERELSGIFELIRIWRE